MADPDDARRRPGRGRTALQVVNHRLRGPAGPDMRPLVRVYAALLRILPGDLRGRFEREMVELFERRLEDAGGRRGRLAVFARAVMDVLYQAIAARRGGTGSSRRAGDRSAGVGSAGAHDAASRVREPSRRPWLPRIVGEFVGDLRYGARSLIRTPVFTGAAVLTLALGIGLNAAAFGAIRSMADLPEVESPAELVQLYRSFPGMDYGANSIPHFLDIRDGTDGEFSGVALWSFVELSPSTGTSNELVVGQMVSSDFFDVLGVEAALGRTFVPEGGEGVGEHPVVVLSHETWTTRFGADPGAIGRTISVNGEPFAIVGVAPPEFRGPMPTTDPALWAPLTMQPQLEPAMGNRFNSRNGNFASVLARLAPGVSIQQARSALAALSTGLREEYPDSYADTEILAVPQEEAGIHPMFADV